jgi:hypothetical protein
LEDNYHQSELKVMFANLLTFRFIAKNQFYMRFKHLSVINLNTAAYFV